MGRGARCGTARCATCRLGDGKILRIRGCNAHVEPVGGGGACALIDARSLSRVAQAVHHVPLYSRLALRLLYGLRCARLSSIAKRRHIHGGFMGVAYVGMLLCGRCMLACKLNLSQSYLDLMIV